MFQLNNSEILKVTDEMHSVDATLILYKPFTQNSFVIWIYTLKLHEYLPEVSWRHTSEKLIDREETSSRTVDANETCLVWGRMEAWELHGVRTTRVPGRKNASGLLFQCLPNVDNLRTVYLPPVVYQMGIFMVRALRNGLSFQISVESIY